MRCVNTNIGKTVADGLNTTSTKYIIDTLSDLPVILCEIDTSAGSSSLIKSYYYAHAQPLAMWDHTNPDGDGDYDDVYFYLHDRLGSVRLVIDEAASVMHRYTYDPYGKVIDQYDDPTIAPTNAFMFTGQWYDAEIGQYCLRARMYDPALMRFTTRDPYKGKFTEPMSLHRYLYCLNDPINHTDRSGLYAVWDDAAAAAAGAICGIFGQLISDLISGSDFDIRNYIASGIGGALGGWASLYLPGPVAGAIAGGSAERLRQVLFGEDFDFGSIMFSIILGSATGAIDLPANEILPDSMLGSNSIAAVSRSMLNQMKSGLVRNISRKTFGKIVLYETVLMSAAASVYGTFDGINRDQNEWIGAPE